MGSLDNLLVSLSYKVDSQRFSELLASSALLGQHFPKHGRISVGCEQSGVGNRE